jgi:hypothetical protein
MTYPISMPREKALPTIAGPRALPTALALVPTPFNVPRIRRLVAELVKRIVQEGKLNITVASLTSMRKKTTTSRIGGGTRTVKGVRKYRMGPAIEVTLKQFKTPYRRAATGKIRNWMSIPMIPTRVYRMPIVWESGGGLRVYQLGASMRTIWTFSGPDEHTNSKSASKFERKLHSGVSHQLLLWMVQEDWEQCVKCHAVQCHETVCQQYQVRLR